jgi:hypothetical protein
MLLDGGKITPQIQILKNKIIIKTFINQFLNKTIYVSTQHIETYIFGL